MKKILISGLLAGLVMLIVGAMLWFAFTLAFSSLKAEYANPALFRPFSDPAFLYLYVVQPFLLGILLSWLWSKTNTLFKEKNWYKNGLRFGFTYWLVTLPGLMLAYASSPFSLLVIVSWSVTGLVQALCAGLIYAKMNR